MFFTVITYTSLMMFICLYLLLWNTCESKQLDDLSTVYKRNLLLLYLSILVGYVYSNEIYLQIDSFFDFNLNFIFNFIYYVENL